MEVYQDILGLVVGAHQASHGSPPHLASEKPFSRRAILICPLHRVVEEEIDLDLELFCGRGRESIIEWGVVCDEWGSVQIWSRLAPGDHLLLYLLTRHRTVSLQMH